MFAVNHVVVSGRVTQEPMIREVGNAKKTKLAKFGIAHNKDFNTGEGSKRLTCFIDIQSWADAASYVESFIHKGDHIIVEGMLATETWKSKLGDTRTRLVIKSAAIHKIPKGAKNADDEDNEEAEAPEEEAPAQYHHVPPEYGPDANAQVSQPEEPSPDVPF